MKYLSLLLLLAQMSCLGIFGNQTLSAGDDSVETNENVAIEVAVLVNDDDPNGNLSGVTIELVTMPTFGSAEVMNNQTILYTPSPDYVGLDRFSYRLKDKDGLFSNEANVSVRVNADALVSWGDDSFNQVTDTPSGPAFVQVSAGGSHSVAIRTNGSLVSWGNNGSSQVTDTPLGHAFVQVSAGGSHSVAIRTNGSLASWGDNGSSQVTDTPLGNDFVQVSAGGYHSVAIRTNGSLVSWGYDGSGRVTDTPLGDDFVQVSAGSSHSVALRTDGSIVSWGYDGGFTPDDLVGSWTCNVDWDAWWAEEMEIWEIIFTEDSFGVVDLASILNDNSYDILNNSLDTYFDLSHADGTLVITVVRERVDLPGGFFALRTWEWVLEMDVSASGWTGTQETAFQNYDAEGNAIPSGDWSEETYEATVVGVKQGVNTFVQMNGGGSHSVALCTDGSLASWGSDGNNQITDTPLENDFVQVSAGGSHSVALRQVD